MEREAPIPAHDKNAQPTLLLSSLAELWSILEPLLVTVRPASVCEIGIGGGLFTSRLVDFSARHACAYTGIDSGLDETKYTGEKFSNAKFIKDDSLNVLAKLQRHDVYFVDGDHNYYMVLNELRLLASDPAKLPLIVLHDVGWPWARRDNYCSPEKIPAAFRHPFSANLGVVPGQDKLGAGGLSVECSSYQYTTAEHENGAHNGVLTAVEDFIREQPANEWKLIVVPAIFGLGILYTPAQTSTETNEWLGMLKSSVAMMKGLLDLMERNRINLFLSYFDAVKKFTNLHGEYDKLKDVYQKLTVSYGELNAHSESLLGSYDDLRKHYEALLESHKKLKGTK